MLPTLWNLYNLAIYLTKLDYFSIKIHSRFKVIQSISLLLFIGLFQTPFSLQSSPTGLYSYFSTKMISFDLPYDNAIAVSYT